MTHLFNVGGMMHHSPCPNYFWWSVISSSGPLFGWEHGARPRSVESSTIDGRNPVDGQTYIAALVLDRGDAATAAGRGREGGVRSQGEGNGVAGNSSPRVSAMSSSALVSGRKHGRRLLACWPAGLISHASEGLPTGARELVPDRVGSCDDPSRPWLS